MSATSPLDLRTGSPVWTTRPAPRVTHAALSRDLSCDVLIIGAVEALGQRARRLGIVADLIDRDSLYLEGDRLDEAGLLTECTARQRAGFETVFLDRQAVKSVLGSAGARRS